MSKLALRAPLPLLLLLCSCTYTVPRPGVSPQRLRYGTAVRVNTGGFFHGCTGVVTAEYSVAGDYVVHLDYCPLSGPTKEKMVYTPTDLELL